MPSNETKAFGHGIESRVIEYEPGKLRVSYSFMGIAVPAIELTGRLPELVAGFSQIKADLEDALLWLKLAEKLLKGSDGNAEMGLQIDTEASRQARGLFVGAVAFYGKCFAEAKGRRARLQKSDVDREFHQAHDRFMAYRNAFACHSGEEKFEHGRTFLLVKPRDMPPLSTVLRVDGARPNLDLAAQDGKLFEDLINHVHDIASKRWQMHGDSMLQRYVWPKGAEFFYSLAERDEPFRVIEKPV